MGPKRDPDPYERPEPVEELGALDLGSTDGQPPRRGSARPPAASGSDDGLRPETHWLAGLVRADALAVASAVTLVVTIIGAPATRMLVSPYGFMIELGAAWMFGPIVVSAVIATLLGLFSVRQAARHGAAGWVRAVGGAATLASAVVAVGTAVTWIYMAESGALDQFSRFFG